MEENYVAIMCCDEGLTVRVGYWQHLEVQSAYNLGNVSVSIA